jgi:hypothetical protein
MTNADPVLLFFVFFSIFFSKIYQKKKEKIIIKQLIIFSITIANY